MVMRLGCVGGVKRALCESLGAWRPYSEIDIVFSVLQRDDGHGGSERGCCGSWRCRYLQPRLEVALQATTGGASPSQAGLEEIRWPGVPRTLCTPTALYVVPPETLHS